VFMATKVSFLYLNYKLKMAGLNSKKKVLLKTGLFFDKESFILLL